MIDTPEFLFEYTAEVVPRKDELLYHKDTGYKVSYICYFVDEDPDTRESGEVYVVAEVAPTEIFFNQQLKAYQQHLTTNR